MRPVEELSPAAEFSPFMELNPFMEVNPLIEVNPLMLVSPFSESIAGLSATLTWPAESGGAQPRQPRLTARALISNRRKGFARTFSFPWCMRSRESTSCAIVIGNATYKNP